MEEETYHTAEFQLESQYEAFIENISNSEEERDAFMELVSFLSENLLTLEAQSVDFWNEEIYFGGETPFPSQELIDGVEHLNIIQENFIANEWFQIRECENWKPFHYYVCVRRMMY